MNTLVPSAVVAQAVGMLVPGAAASAPQAVSPALFGDLLNLCRDAGAGVPAVTGTLAPGGSSTGGDSGGVTATVLSGGAGPSTGMAPDKVPPVAGVVIVSEVSPAGEVVSTAGRSMHAVRALFAPDAASPSTPTLWPRSTFHGVPAAAGEAAVPPAMKPGAGKTAAPAQPPVASTADEVPPEVLALALGVQQAPLPARPVTVAPDDAGDGAEPPRPGVSEDQRQPSRSPAFAATHAQAPALDADVRTVTSGQREPVATVRPTEGVAQVAVSSPTGDVRTVANARSESPEKIAATVRPAGMERAEPLVVAAENKFLTIDKKTDAKREVTHGTGNARQFADMTAVSENKPVTTAAPVPVDVVRPAAEAGDVMTPALDATLFRADGPVRSEKFDTPQVVRSQAADAAGVVREVAELTHDFRMTERSSVEVRFSFRDQTELTVRLAYRDGEVQTTFRADSEELLATLGREWRQHAAGFAQEVRGHRVADPVFTGNADASGSPAGRDAGSSAGGDARQQHSAQPDHQRGSRHTGAGFAQARTAPSSAPAPVVRVSSDRILQAFA